MSIAYDDTTQSLNQQWDVKTLPITRHDHNWGISRELNDPIIRLLEALGLYKDISGNKIISVKVLQVLAKYMQQQKIDLTNLSEAVNRLMTDQQKVITQEMQHVLNRFVSVETASPAFLPTDGIWSSACEQLLQKIANDYQITDRSPGPDLLKQLSVIASRLVRVNLKERLQPPLIGGNSFLIIDSAAPRFSLQFASEDDANFYLSDDSADRQQLVSINWRRSWQADANSFSPSFEKFSMYMMLLQMNTRLKYHSIAKILVEKDGNEPVDLEEFYNPTAGRDFVEKVDYILHFPDQFQTIPIRFLPHSGRNDANIIAVLCSENFEMALTQGYRNAPQPDNGIAALIDFEYFFRNAEPDNPIQCIKKGNMLKLFVVSKSFGKGETGNEDFNISPSDITALLKADEKDILASITIGLNFDSSTIQQQKEENDESARHNMIGKIIGNTRDYINRYHDAETGRVSYSLILNDGGNNKIQVLKKIREITDLGLAEAKDIIDKAPHPIESGISHEKCLELIKEFNELGASVSIRPGPGKPFKTWA